MPKQPRRKVHDEELIAHAIYLAVGVVVLVVFRWFAPELYASRSEDRGVVSVMRLAMCALTVAVWPFALGVAAVVGAVVALLHVVGAAFGM